MSDAEFYHWLRWNLPRIKLTIDMKGRCSWQGLFRRVRTKTYFSLRNLAEKHRDHGYHIAIPPYFVRTRITPIGVSEFQRRSRASRDRRNVLTNAKRRTPEGRKKQNARKRRYYFTHREEIRRYESSEQFRARRRPKERAYHRKAVKCLSDGYVRKLLRQGTILKDRDFPPEIVELQRQKIRLLRDIRKAKNNENNARNQGNPQSANGRSGS